MFIVTRHTRSGLTKYIGDNSGSNRTTQTGQKYVYKRVKTYQDVQFTVFNILFSI